MGLGIRRSAIAVAVAAVVMLASFVTAHDAAATTPSTRWRGTFSARYTMPAGTDGAGSWPMRNYHVYVPRDLPARGKRSVVVYLHGTTQTAVDAANGVMWNDLADTEKFIVVYPEEATTAEGGDAADGSSDLRYWAWGRAAFEKRGDGEMRTIARITQTVMTTYGADPGSVFIGGASAGAIMSVIMAATYPDLYAAVGSWAGCNYLCSDPTGLAGYKRMGGYARPVPAILFAGSADYVVNPALTSTQVTGIIGMNDYADDGLFNGSVARRPASGPKTYGGLGGGTQAGARPGADRQWLQGCERQSQHRLSGRLARLVGVPVHRDEVRLREDGPATSSLKAGSSTG